ncbi:hypothetical protein NBRC116598_18670 [Pseudophaeobacter arcticus]|uniref:Uncharacterized protein n=1 Tax=Pseudophaeobacter arcticus TaxID=385492 RepID=A0ABQ0AKM8_9RHOB
MCPNCLPQKAEQKAGETVGQGRLRGLECKEAGLGCDHRHTGDALDDLHVFFVEGGDRFNQGFTPAR